jgi:hypothetical protein
MNNNQDNNQAKNQAKEIEAQLKNYTGPEGITTKQLEIGLWYVEHRQLLKRILASFLILVAAIAWAYTIYGFAYYFTRGISEDEKLTKQLVEASAVGHDYVLQLSAKQLFIAPVGVLKSAGNKYDFYVQLRNGNQKWWAEFDYYFAVAGGQTAKTKGFILPLESKYLLALAQEVASRPDTAQLIMENISWHRLNQHQIPNWSAFERSHLNIVSTDIKFTPASSLLSEKLNLNQLSFKVANQTAFNFWQAGFNILLYGGGALVDVNHYILDDFMSGQERAVEISWPGSLPWVNRVEIAPDINIMKDDIYIPYEGGVGQEK